MRAVSSFFALGEDLCLHGLVFVAEKTSENAPKKRANSPETIWFQDFLSRLAEISGIEPLTS